MYNFIAINIFLESKFGFDNLLKNSNPKLLHLRSNVNLLFQPLKNIFFFQKYLLKNQQAQSEPLTYFNY